MLWILLIDVTMAFADAFVDLVVDVEVGVNESVGDALVTADSSWTLTLLQFALATTPSF